MNLKNLKDTLGNSDIYVIDQILKARYHEGDKILDAGTGSGRNLHWFYASGFDIWGVDQDPENVDYVKQLYPKCDTHFITGEISDIPFTDHYFDHIICCAVLHFARDTSHFKQMFAELARVLKPGGSLLIRMTSNIGIEKYVTPVGNGIYQLGDQSERFLLTKPLLQEVLGTFSLQFLEPLRSTNVSDLRCMSTLLLEKV